MGTSEEDTAAQPAPMHGVSPAAAVEEETGTGLLRLYEVRDNKIAHVVDPKSPAKDIGYQCVAEVRRPCRQARPGVRRGFSLFFSLCVCVCVCFGGSVICCGRV